MIQSDPRTAASIRTTTTTTSSSTSRDMQRGAFIVFEGVDRCGKTTQAGMLVRHLLSLGIAALAFRFPDRTTLIGQMINSYLQQQTEQDDRAIHLLFSANRWESAPALRKAILEERKTVVCDRYAYSGVAFSSAKPGMDTEWCRTPDVGLPAPDAVIFLDLAQDEAAKRGGYGGERYEQQDMQQRVRQRFAELQQMDERQRAEDNASVPTWHIVDAARSIEDVQKDINAIVEETIASIQKENRSLATMWPEVVQR